MYKVFLMYPDVLRPVFPRLKEKLEDTDIGTGASVRTRACFHMLSVRAATDARVLYGMQALFRRP